MNIQVEYVNSSGIISQQQIPISRLAFIKHLAFAGQGYSICPKKLLRTISMFCYYSNFIKRENFNNNKFSELPIELTNPTDKAQFSNHAGIAIADFLSKKIDNSIFTVNYEAALKLQKMSLGDNRPDLLAFNTDEIFAIEAKGLDRGSIGIKVLKNI